MVWQNALMNHQYLTSILSYDPATGFFHWALPRPKIQVGQKAGYLKKNKGYVYIEIDAKAYSGHRLAWFYVTGKMPVDQIDHINRNKSDNRFENLREASSGQNRANSKTTNKHGLKGVRRLPWMNEADRCWQASITHKKMVTYLGCFHTKEEAHSAYCEAAKTLHGEFFNP
jgi:hypothetical protein